MCDERDDWDSEAEDDGYYEDSSEWQPDRGECDNCPGGEPVIGPLGPMYCACRIGQGAAEEDCVCGPEEG